jgi:hypothetical protein
LIFIGSVWILFENNICLCLTQVSLVLNESHGMALNKVTFLVFFVVFLNFFMTFFMNFLVAFLNFFMAFLVSQVNFMGFMGLMSFFDFLKSVKFMNKVGDFMR